MCSNVSELTYGMFCILYFEVHIKTSEGEMLCISTALLEIVTVILGYFSI